MSKRQDKLSKPITEVRHLLFELHKLLDICIKKKSSSNSKTFICELDDNTHTLLVETINKLCEKIHIVFSFHNIKLGFEFYDEILDNSTTLHIVKMLNIVYSSQHTKSSSSDLCNSIQSLLALFSKSTIQESNLANDYLNEF